MSTYLGRPVFPFPVNWAETAGSAFVYDPKMLFIGMAAPVAHRLPSYTIRGYNGSVLLATEAEIEEWDAFVGTCKGRLNGFWIRAHEAAFKVSAAIDSTHFTIEDIGLRHAYSSDDTPSQHIECVDTAGVVQRASISSVVEGTDGLELVTLTAAATPQIDQTWSVYRLLYVRFTRDEFDAEYVADNRQRVRVEVIELPDEYAAIETGQQPVYLYEVTDPEGNISRWTSLNVDVVSNGQTYTSYPVTHHQHRWTLNGGAAATTLETWHADNNPLALLFPPVRHKPFHVAILAADYSTPSTTRAVFSGYTTGVQLQGRRMQIKCEALMEAAGRKFPRFFIQARCNYALFSTSCGVIRSSLKVTGTIKDMGGRNVLVEGVVGTFAANYFTLGYLTLPANAITERFGIESSLEASGGEVYLTLTGRLAHAVPGDAVELYPGCDGAAETCKTKFNNFTRFGGHVMAPSNLMLRAMEPETSTGNKK